MTFPLLNSGFDFDAVIVGNGDYPSHAVARRLLARAPFVCACDGAAVSLIDHGITPDVIVGDGDSLPVAQKTQYADILHIENEQDDNDQTKATRLCQSLDRRRLVYLGMTGKREDHTIGNISLLAQYHNEMQLEPVMVTDYGYFVPAFGHSTFTTFIGQQVSLFNISCQTLSGHGLRWQPYAGKSLWQGTLNEALGSRISLEGDGEYLVYLTHEAKNSVR